jgi:tRNA(Arg) A34 adenosine deaminase TadA
MSREDVLTRLLVAAVAHSRCHVERGGIPFVGVVVSTDGVVSGYGVNQVHQTGDPTAHAEIVALRDIAAGHGADAVRGATLLATGEPCTLCYRSAADSGIERVIYAVDQDTAADWGFDYRGGRDSLTPAQRGLVERAEHRPVTEHLAPFVSYAQLHGIPAPIPGPSVL